MSALRKHRQAARTSYSDSSIQLAERHTAASDNWPGVRPLLVVPDRQSSLVLPDDPPVLARRREAASEFDQNSDLVLNPDFALVRSDYRVRLASQQSHLHTKASELVASMYGSRGLVTGSTAVTSVSEAPTGQVTLAASAGNHVFGTLTLGMDSEAGGLMADSLYRAELDEMRAEGRRLCEVTRLALNPELSTPEVMATIFNVAFIVAREVHGRTDLIAEVHPRHTGFYRRTMGYRIVGPERICDRVSAPAVLMHLCLDFARNQIHQLGGSSTEGERSLYKLFLPASEQDTLLKKLIIPESAAL